MKKFALTAVAAAALSAGVAQAYTVGTFSNGFVVPNVVHNGAANTTAVGLINETGNTVPVFWTFFDQNSNHVTDGCFAMTDKQYRGFNWADNSGVGLAGKRGYLVFAVGANSSTTTSAGACAAANASLSRGGQISANAFFVDIAGKSVAFTPVIDGPLALSGNLTTLGPASLTGVAGAAQVPVTTLMAMRYYIDGVVNSGNDTRIAVWSTGDQRGTHTVNIFDDQQNRKSVNFKLTESELSWFDPETIEGRPASFVDGFIEWNPSVPPSDAPSGTGTESPLANGGSVMSYSTIIAPAFGAVQSLLGAHRPIAVP
ncbi:MAG: hypothetical protein JSS19_02650 [Proteobacteria bacterium]|nr:hypothetical protein [Pseudomonadota bacterium]